MGTTKPFTLIRDIFIDCTIYPLDYLFDPNWVLTKQTITLDLVFIYTDRHVIEVKNNNGSTGNK